MKKIKEFDDSKEQKGRMSMYPGENVQDILQNRLAYIRSKYFKDNPPKTLDLDKYDIAVQNDLMEDDSKWQSWYDRLDNEDDEKKTNKRRYFPPKTITFSKDIRNLFKEHFKLINGSSGYTLYISPLLQLALEENRRGKSKDVSELSKLVSEKMPGDIRLLFKKHMGKINSTLNMIPIMLTINSVSNGDIYFENPNHGDNKDLKYNYITEENEEQNTWGHEEIIQSLRKQLANMGKTNKYNVKLIDKRPGKTDKTVEMRFDEKGELHAYKISDDPIKESFKDNVVVGVVCTILASGAVSCKKDTEYNIGRDLRFRLKPEILDQLGKSAYDNPKPGKAYMYIWAGNQNGASEPTRYGYWEYSNDSNKHYGSIQGKVYPDSVQDGAVNVPQQVIEVKPAATTKFNLPDSIRKNYKYVFVTKVYTPTQWKWADINKGEEVGWGRFMDFKDCYTVYVTNYETVEVGDLYSTFPTTRYIGQSTGYSSFGIINDPKNILAVADYVNPSAEPFKQKPEL